MFAIKMKPFMGVSEGTEAVSEYEPPHRVVLKGRMGKLAPTTILTVEPEGQGSRLTRRVEMKPPGMLRVMDPFMKGMAHKQAAGFLENLKQVLEAS